MLNLFIMRTKLKETIKHLKADELTNRYPLYTLTMVFMPGRFDSYSIAIMAIFLLVILSMDIIRRQQRKLKKSEKNFKQAEKMLKLQLESEKILSDISSKFAAITAKELNQGINFALRLSGSFFNVDRSYIFVFSDDTEQAMNNSHEWCAEGITPQIDNLQGVPNAMLPWWMNKLRNLENINIPSIDDLPPEAEAEKKFLQLQFIQSLVAVPMISRNKLLGFIGFDSVREKKKWADEQISLLKVVAEIISNALLQNRALKALEKSEEKFRYMAEFSPHALSICSRQEKFEYLNPKFTETFGYTLTEIPDRNRWFELAHPDPLYRRHVLELWHNDAKNIENGIATSRIFQISCKDGSEKEILIRTVAMGNDNFLATYEDITKQRRAVKKIEAYALELEKLCSQLDTEIDKARKVHERTMPGTLPAVKGLSFAAHYQPALKLGGDLYDVIKKENKLIAYLSDVTGHSMDGAMLSVFVNNTIDSFISLNEPENITPEKLCKFLAEQYHKENYPDEYFICIFLVVLDLNTKELSYTGAGFQDSPLVRMGNGEQLMLISKGLPISLAFPATMPDFHAGTIVLTPGTTILFNTDGLTEHEANGKFYGERLEKVFYENSHLPPEMIIEAVNEDFTQFNNGSRQGFDDITFLVMQVEAEVKKKLHFKLQSSFEELMKMHKKISEVLHPEYNAEMLVMGIDEMVANAIEHGNKFNLDKKVTVEIVLAGRYILATVEDEGEGFDWREKVTVPMELSGNRERGRGIPLAVLCCDSIVYNQKGNKVYIIKEQTPDSPLDSLINDVKRGRPVSSP